MHNLVTKVNVFSSKFDLWKKTVISPIIAI